MARVVSVHEHELRPGVQPACFERALREAECRGLLELPGLVAHHFLKGSEARDVEPEYPEN